MSRKTKNILLKTRMEVAPYGGTFHLVVAEDAPRARREMDHIFGVWDDTEFTALHSYNHAGHSGLFFYARWLTHEHIAHEVFHAAHRILHWAGLRFDICNQEAHSHMQGWLTKQVYAAIKKAGLTVQ